jgi:hypothetical protein
MGAPAPTLDHVFINVRDEMDRAAEAYRRLGFQLTERGRHSRGTINHLAVFETNYLELIGMEKDSKPLPNDFRQLPAGWLGMLFGTDDSLALYRDLSEKGVPVEQPMELSRPVDLPGGKREDARFRVVPLVPGAVASGRVMFCHHFTRHLVWRSEWQRHPNGATGIARGVIVAANPAQATAIFAALFGPGALEDIDGGRTLRLQRAQIDFITAEALASRFGAGVPEAAGREEYMAALGFRTTSLDLAVQALEAGGIREMWRMQDRVVVAAREAMNVTVEFLV